MRRSARSLVENTPARFPISSTVEDAATRLRAALGAELGGEVSPERVVLWETGRPQGLTAARFEGRWISDADGVVLEGAFQCSPRVPGFLRTASMLLGVLVIASIWVVLTSTDSTVRFLLPLASGFAVMGFPLGVLALASYRQAAETRVSRAIKRRLA